jgi:hypothetical protein
VIHVPRRQSFEVWGKKEKGCFIIRVNEAEAISVDGV